MKYNCNKMREFASAIMQKNGLSKQKSDLFAESLIAADMRGISSHGVTRLKHMHIVWRRDLSMHMQKQQL